MGRRAGISDTERLFREEFANALRQLISTERGSASRLARRLGISRQSLSLYLHRNATPSAEVVRRICTTFNLSLNVRGHIVSEKSFQKRVEQPRLSAVPHQLTFLPNAIHALQDDQLKVQVIQKLGDSIDLRVRIDFSKKTG